jgi:hypothetical protein
MTNYRIDYQPQLVEEAVLLAMSGHEDEHLFRWERDQVYERFEEAEAREAAFQHVHRSWFEILGMGEPLQACLDTWPILREATERCLVMKARAPKEAGAELYCAAENAAPGNRTSPVILIQITPGLLTQPAACLAFLRHESLHVVDMLDPHFEYVPDLPKSNAGPAHDQLLQNRYAVLWDIIIDGRLHQRGWLSPAAREKHFADFKRAFQGEAENVAQTSCLRAGMPALPSAAIEVLSDAEAALAQKFADFFDHNSHTHGELLAFAQHPEKWLQPDRAMSSSPARCGLCHFPTSLLLAPHELRVEVKREIQIHFPAWQEAEPVCRQCVDLYEARLV